MSNHDHAAEPGPLGPPGGNGGGTPQAEASKSVRDQVLGYLIPVIPLVILFLVFAGIILFSDHILQLKIPDLTRSFIFIILTFFVCAVYLTKVLGENTSIKINGWALNGALAVIFVVGYFAVERFPDIAKAVGLGAPPLPSVDFPFAEVQLRCGASGGQIAQAQRIYTYMSGDQSYVEFARQALKNPEGTGSPDSAGSPDGEQSKQNLVPVEMVKEGTPQHAFFLNKYLKSNQTDWLAYSVAAKPGRVPIPTRLNEQHILAFYIDPPQPRESAEDIAEMAGGPVSAGLIQVATVTIEPKEIEGPKRHVVEIVLNVLGDQTPCWNPAIPEGL